MAGSRKLKTWDTGWDKENYIPRVQGGIKTTTYLGHRVGSRKLNTWDTGWDEENYKPRAQGGIKKNYKP